MDDDAFNDRMLAQVSAPALHDLYAYWKSKRRAGGLPARGDIDPADLTFLLGNIVLLEVVREASRLRFRYRLTGSVLTGRAGFDPIDTFLDEHPEPTFREMATRTMTTVVDSRRPYAAARDMFIDGRVRRYDVLALPLGADGHSVDMLLVAMVYWE